MKNKFGLGLLFFLVSALAALFSLGALSADALVADAQRQSPYVQEGLVFQLLPENADLASSVWTSSVSSADSARLAGNWQRNENGSIGFRLEGLGSAGLDIGIEDLPQGDYTFEMVLFPYGLTNGAGEQLYFPDTSKYGMEYGTGMAFGPLKAETFPALRGEGNTLHENPLFGSHQNRWFYQPVGGWQDYGKEVGGFSPLYEDNTFLAEEMISWALSHETDGTSSQYEFYHNGVSSAKSRISDRYATPAESDGLFRVLYSFPADVFVIRLYNRVLTEGEKLQNFMADLATYCGLDISAYLAAEESVRFYVGQQMASSSFSEPKAVLQERLDAAMEREPRFLHQVLAESFFVQEGLTTFLSAYDLFSQSVMLREQSASWYDVADHSFLTLSGSGWTAEQGLYRPQTYGEYQKGDRYGLDLGLDRLPGEEYTVEMVLSPYGLRDEAGERYLDEKSPYGTYHDFGFALGPLKALVFPTARPAGKTGDMEKRWIYLAKGGWSAANYSPLLVDYGFRKTKDGLPVSYCIRHQRTAEGGSDYTFYQGGGFVGRIKIAESEYVAPAATEGMFRLMWGFPASFYCLRIYDRVLTEEEQQQNHFADLCYYYGWDVSLCAKVLSLVGDKTAFFQSFADVDFSLSEEAAQEALLRILAAQFLAPEGLSARLDACGIRGVYRLKEEAVALLEAAGYSLDCGASVAFGDQEFSAIFYQTEGAPSSFRLVGEEALYALALSYRRPDAQMLLSSVSFFGWVSVKDERGELLFSAKLPSPEALPHAFSVYYALEAGDYADNAHVSSLVDLGFAKTEIQVGPGDSLAAAHASALAILASSPAPQDITLRLLGDSYALSAPLEIRGEEILSSYYRLSYVGEGAALSGAQTLSPSGFAETATPGIYAYSFGADAQDFRCLLVDGVLQAPAQKGASLSMDPSIRKGKHPNGKNADGSATTQPKLYVDADLVAGLTERDLETLEMHWETNWEYYACHVDRVDFSDRTSDGCVALYLRAEEYQECSFVNTFVDCYYWLANAALCLEEAGDYFYSPSEKTLYFMAGEGKTPADYAIAVPRLESLLRMQNVENISFRGISFRETDARSLSEAGHNGGQAGAGSALTEGKEVAVYGENVRRISFSECLFSQLGGEGLLLRGVVQEVSVVGCQFLGLGATAVHFGNYSEHWQEGEHTNQSIQVVDNHFAEIALRYRECCVILMDVGYDVLISQNSIVGCSYSGISVGWRWQSAKWGYGERIHLENVEISYNYITGFMREMRDGGAIYTLGGNVEKSYPSHLNWVFGNYILVSRDTGDRRCYFMCIYHDGASSHWHTYDNVIVENPSNRRFDSATKSGQVYIHLQQYIGANGSETGQAAFRITVEHCYVVAVKSDPADSAMILAEIFGGAHRVEAARDLYALEMQYLRDPEALDAYGLMIVKSAGSRYCQGDYQQVLRGEY